MKLLSLSAIAGFALLAGQAMAFQDCTAPGYLSEFVSEFGMVPGSPGQPCRQLWDGEMVYGERSANVRLIRLGTGDDGFDAQNVALTEQAVDRIGSALAAMERVFVNDEITIVLPAAPFPTDGIFISYPSDAAEECTLVLDDASFFSGVTSERATFALAKSIFDCAIAVTWPWQSTAAGADWWVLGSAEYFANLAQPGTGQSRESVSAFDTGSLEAGITTLGSENVVVFSYLAGISSPGQIAYLLEGMPARTEGLDAQNRGLERVLSFLYGPATWQDFVESYLDGEVELPGGHGVPAPQALRTTQRFPPDTAIEFAVDPFQIDRVVLQFDADQQFDLQADDGVGFFTQMRPVNETGTWAPTPDHVDTCEGAKDFLHYFTTTNSTPVSSALAVQADELGAAGCCLIGTWAPTEEVLAAASLEMTHMSGMDLSRFGLATASPASRGLTFECFRDGGAWRLMFDESLTGRVTYDNDTASCEMAGDRGAMVQTTTRNGEMEFTWTIIAEEEAEQVAGAEGSLGDVVDLDPVDAVETGNLPDGATDLFELGETGTIPMDGPPGGDPRTFARIVYGNTSVSWKYDFDIMGQQMGQPPRVDGGPWFRVGSFGYVCEGNDLVIEGLYGVGPGAAKHTRVLP